MKCAGWVVTAGLLVVAGCASTSEPAAPAAEAAPVIKPQEAQYVVLVGAGSDPYIAQPPPRDHASGSGAGMMYPGDAGAGGFVASIIMHAAIQSGITKARERAFYEQSQMALQPYQEMLASVDLGMIKQQAMTRLQQTEPRIALSGQAEHAYAITLDPVFVLTHSKDAWGVTATSRVFQSLTAALEETDPLHQRDIYVESLPVPNADWQSQQGEAFRQVMRTLFMELADLALNDFLGTLPALDDQETTIRYLANGTKQVERGRIIQQQDSKILFQSLSGELKLLPALGSEESAGVNNK